MAINPNLAFGPISQAVDLIVQDNERAVARQFTQQHDEARAEQEESRFRRSRGLQASLSLLSKKGLTEESRGAIGKSIPGLISEGGELTTPEFKPTQQVEIGQIVAKESGLEVGSLMDVDKANKFLKRGLDKRRFQLSQEKEERISEGEQTREERLQKNVDISAKERESRKERQSDKDFLSNLNSLTLDNRRKITGLTKLEEGERIPIEGKNDEVAALQVENEALETIERIERDLEEPESAAQIAQWMEAGFFGKDKKMGMEMAQDFDLLPESREEVKELFRAEPPQITREEAKLIIKQFKL